MRQNEEKQKFWNTHIEAQKASGLSAKKYCEQQGLVHHKFRYHQAKRRKTSKVLSNPRFLPVRIETKQAVTLEVSGIRIGFDPETPAATVAAIILEVSKQNEVS
ncbi:IS66 family insertion sequence element accessory protein TnpA [Pseudobacteriovorax antillogorgiicola]|uniref:Uncharacterized protein n=1 Tax=Pseudobacteriovorax antillogorgiicola TaxID=1513793 RepID=A0A1Y6CRM7_9BACT|nr:hypothetical protein [Pseudobacteriovorax antillogorgiicola]TCS45922.1 hypothetical protein EDD56_12685 [Pseudobacteriovorax antillogorgiicola]SMF71038.1 hypothetical protein SAMN06296036_12613 [Pseudobacteriovorax antillogorgiicola]